MVNLTAKQVSMLSNSIFFKLDFEGEWKVLTDFDGNTFETMIEAKTFVRENLGKKHHVELSSFEQALMDNGQWDNIQIMKVNESLWEALKNTIEMHTEQDPNITDVLINYQVKESNGVKNIIKLNATLE